VSECGNSDLAAPSSAVATSASLDLEPKLTEIKRLQDRALAEFTDGFPTLWFSWLQLRLGSKSTQAVFQCLGRVYTVSLNSYLRVQWTPCNRCLTVPAYLARPDEEYASELPKSEFPIPALANMPLGASTRHCRSGQTAPQSGEES
jgi:hypothetical protein